VCVDPSSLRSRSAFYLHSSRRISNIRVYQVLQLTNGHFCASSTCYIRSSHRCVSSACPFELYLIFTPFQHKTYPLKLTDPDTVPTNNTVDPHPLPPPASSSGILNAAVTQLRSISTNSFFTNDTCASCQAALEIGKFVSLATPSNGPAFFIEFCNTFKLSSTCSVTYDRANSGAVLTQVVANADVGGYDGQVRVLVLSWRTPYEWVLALYRRCVKTSSICVPLRQPFRWTFRHGSQNPSLRLYLNRKREVAKDSRCYIFLICTWTPVCPCRRFPLCVLNVAIATQDMQQDPKPTAHQVSAAESATPRHPLVSLHHALVLFIGTTRLCSFLPVFTDTSSSDTPMSLALSALEAIPELTGTKGDGFAWTLYTGDLVSHDAENQLSRLVPEYMR